MNLCREVKCMSEEKRIYKKYIGEEDKLEKLTSWFYLFHVVIALLAKEGDNEKLIGDLIKNKLHINYTYTKKKKPYKEINIEELQKIRLEYECYYRIYKEKEFNDFKEMENHKLVLYAIIKKYFEVLRKESITSFHKLAQNNMFKKMKGEYMSRYFENKLSNFSVILFSFLSILFFTACIISLIVFGLDYLGIYNSIFVPLIVLISLVIAMLLTIKIEKIAEKLIPSYEFDNIRDLSEEQKYYTLIGLLISALMLLVTIFSLTLKVG